MAYVAVMQIVLFNTKYLWHIIGSSSNMSDSDTVIFDVPQKWWIIA
jgi:hypothetical protein